MTKDIGGVRAHWEVLGSAGETLLLLHGWGPGTVSLQSHMKPLALSLKDNFRVYMLDFPGHGESGMPPSDWGVPEYARWTLQVMDELALPRASLVAHSFGGRVALWLAANHPDRVEKLVLTGCAGLRPRRPMASRARALLFKLGRAGLGAAGLVPTLRPRAQAALAKLRAEFASADYLATPERLRAGFSNIVRQDLLPLLPKIRQPVLLVWGENDTATPLWMAREMEENLADARLLVYAADDHWAYLNQLARFVTAAEVFLTGGAPL
ncbi:MAG TPA: alpha/beta hydrolase [Candidatus Limnocylindria bacterium]|nr:alpha/beta hydrolase [Candidatus Limnocylindria bacterium]